MQEQRKQTLWRKLAPFKWRIIGGLSMLLVAILFLTIGFWKTMLIVLLVGIGLAFGFAKDRTEDFLVFLDKMSR